MKIAPKKKKKKKGDIKETKERKKVLEKYEKNKSRITVLSN